MEKFKFFKSPFQIMGFVALYACISIIIGGVQNYIEQNEQLDWTLYTAEVTDISSRVERSGSRKHSSSRTVYDIIYEYEVDGVTYTEELENASKIRKVGDSLKIKYDPEAPENSTTILVPSIRDLIVTFVIGIVFGVIGFFTSGIYWWIRWIRRGGEPEEEEILPPEEYVEVEKPEPVKHPWLVLFVRRVIPMLIVFGLIILAPQLSFHTRSIAAEQFQSTAEEKGYTTLDTTTLLRGYWKIGSLLKQSMSIEEENFRVDFCVMDSLGSAKSLYNGMTLPVTDGEKVEENDMGRMLISMENEEMYTAKIRVRNTVIYVAATPEYKEAAIDLLEEIGYWEE